MLYSSLWLPLILRICNKTQKVQLGTNTIDNRPTLALVPHCDRASSDYRKLQPPKACCRISIPPFSAFSQSCWNEDFEEQSWAVKTWRVGATQLSSHSCMDSTASRGNISNRWWQWHTRLSHREQTENSPALPQLTLFMRNTHRGSTSLCELNQQACNTTVEMTLHGETKIRRMYIIIVFLFKEDERKAFDKLCHRKHCFTVSLATTTHSWNELNLCQPELEVLCNQIKNLIWIIARSRPWFTLDPTKTCWGWKVKLANLIISAGSRIAQVAVQMPTQLFWHAAPKDYATLN